MKNNEKIIFDELDKKCIEELPIIIEVLASTFNKIARLFSIYFKEIEEILTKELKNKKSWEVKKIKENHFFPFNYYEEKITNLNNSFFIINRIVVTKLVNKNEKNNFIVEIGYLYADIDDEPKSNSFYFSIYKEDWAIKKYGKMYDLSFYENIKNKNLNIDFWYPDDDYVDEGIEIVCKEVNENKLDQTFETYKTQILKPYLNNLK